MAENKEKQYVSDNAQLMAEWGWDKNNDLDPSTVSCGSSKKVWWTCKEGHEWEAQIKNRTKGSGCPHCYHARQRNLPSRNGLQKTHEEFVDDLRRRNPNELIIIGKYTTARGQIEWECKECKKHIFSSPKHLYTATGLCSECLNARIAEETIKKNKENFLKGLQERDNPPELLEDYKGMLKPIKVRCSICGYIWSATPSNLLRYVSACPECERNNRVKTHVDFISELTKINPYIKVLGEYFSSHSPIECQCLLCNYTWSPRPYSLLNGVGCPNCNHSSTSFVEQLIFLSLKFAYPQKSIISRDRSTIGCELDIYLPEDCIAIEYGAWHWHENRLMDDLDKIRICREHGIRLVVVYDACKEIPIESNNTDVLCYRTDLGRNLPEAQAMIHSLFCVLGLDSSRIPALFSDIANQAYLQSRKTSTIEFIKRMQSINPQIEIIGEYCASNKKIGCQCKICGYYWDSVPYSLISGHGCPSCTGHFTRRLTDEEYRQRLAVKHPSITLLGKYTNGRDVQQFICNNCGATWTAQLKSLLQGKGCPQCARKKRKKT